MQGGIQDSRTFSALSASAGVGGEFVLGGGLVAGCHAVSIHL